MVISSDVVLPVRTVVCLGAEGFLENRGLTTKVGKSDTGTPCHIPGSADGKQLRCDRGRIAKSAGQL